MLRLLKLAAVAAALWAVWAFVPVHGRTLAARWRAAPDAGAFAAAGWAELRGAVAGHGAARRGAERRAQGRAARDGRPVEGHTDADRRAVDRILARHLEESR